MGTKNGNIRLTKNERNQIKSARRQIKTSPEPREAQRVLSTLRQGQRVEF